MQIIHGYNTTASDKDLGANVRTKLKK